jgi:large subunit ribosomal protein L28
VYFSIHLNQISFADRSVSLGKICNKEAAAMSRICQVTGKRPMAGNNVSHAKNRTRRRFEPNLHSHRFWIESEKRFVKLRVSTKGMRIIDKNGIEQVLADLRAKGEKI